MLHTCGGCHQHFKHDEPRCPHCGRAVTARVGRVLLGVAVAAAVGAGAAAHAADGQVRPLYGVPPMRKPPPTRPAPDAGQPDAGPKFGLGSN